jgi:hypothetical protein
MKNVEKEEILLVSALQNVRASEYVKPTWAENRQAGSVYVHDAYVTSLPSRHAVDHDRGKVRQYVGARTVLCVLSLLTLASPPLTLPLFPP